MQVVHAFSHIICICTRVAAAAEEVVYEVVAEPQEPQEKALQQGDHGESAQGQSHPSTEPQTQGKPQCITPISNYATLYMYIYLFLCIKVIGVEWNLRCITLRSQLVWLASQIIKTHIERL